MSHVIDHQRTDDFAGYVHLVAKFWEQNSRPALFLAS
jgi:hypothetical protein